jgi:protein TonB
MFERSVLSGDEESRRPWTFSVSLLAQVLLVAVAILVPLLSEPLMPALSAALVSLETPRPPRSVPPPPPERVVVLPEVFTAELRQPREISVDVLRVIDSSPEVASVESFPYGLSDRSRNTVMNSIISNPTVTPPPALAPESESTPEPVAIRVSSQIQAAKILRRIQPVYPQFALTAWISGIVRLQAVIEGHPLLVRAAIAAVSQWRYRPTVLNGIPVPVDTQIEVNFTLAR